MLTDRVVVRMNEHGRGTTLVYHGNEFVEKYTLPFMAMNKPVTGKETTFEEFSKSPDKVRGWLRMPDGSIRYCRRLTEESNVIVVHHTDCVELVEVKDGVEVERKVNKL